MKTNVSLTSIEINGETYVKQSEIFQKEYLPSPIQIVILNRGWIVIGNVSTVNSKTIIQKVSVIRNWGTKKGLGQLALEGMQSETVLDPCGDISVDTINVVCIMNCNQDKWK